MYGQSVQLGFDRNVWFPDFLVGPNFNRTGIVVRVKSSFHSVRFIFGFDFGSIQVRLNIGVSVKCRFRFSFCILVVGLLGSFIVVPNLTLNDAFSIFSKIFFLVSKLVTL